MRNRAKVQNETIAPVQVSLASYLRSTAGRPSDIKAQISRRAYELYCARGRRAGKDLEDWLRAEKEIMES